MVITCPECLTAWTICDNDGDFDTRVKYCTICDKKLEDTFIMSITFDMMNPAFSETAQSPIPLRMTGIHTIDDLQAKIKHATGLKPKFSLLLCELENVICWPHDFAGDRPLSDFNFTWGTVIQAVPVLFYILGDPEEPEDSEKQQAWDEQLAEMWLDLWETPVDGDPEFPDYHMVD